MVSAIERLCALGGCPLTPSLIPVDDDPTVERVAIVERVQKVLLARSEPVRQGLCRRRRVE